MITEGTNQNIRPTGLQLCLAQDRIKPRFGPSMRRFVMRSKALTAMTDGVKHLVGLERDVSLESSPALKKRRMGRKDEAEQARRTPSCSRSGRGRLARSDYAALDGSRAIVTGNPPF